MTDPDARPVGTSEDIGLSSHDVQSLVRTPSTVYNDDTRRNDDILSQESLVSSLDLSPSPQRVTPDDADNPEITESQPAGIATHGYSFAGGSGENFATEFRQNFHGRIDGRSTAYPHQHESIFRAIPGFENARLRRKELPDAAQEMQKSAFPIGK